MQYYELFPTNLPTKTRHSQLSDLFKSFNVAEILTRNSNGIERSFNHFNEIKGFFRLHIRAR